MRRLAALLALIVPLATLPAAAQLQESITVERILLDVRVTEFGGQAITDVRAEEFEVEIGNKRAEVLSATWVDDLPPLPGSEGEELTFRLPRLFVFFIQTDFARNTARLEGQMHFLQYAEELLEGLADDDRIAVFSFDSHLKFRLDFTRDKRQVLEAMRQSLNIDIPPPPPIVESPSLARGLDPKEMKRAADSEAALLLIGNALRPIPGRKSLFLMGWGLGEYSPRAGVRMKPKYRIARAALEAARVTIFALDTTNADYHDLEIGLGTAAKDTGGFYAKTHIFPEHAIERLHRTLAGHYELELRRPDRLKPGTHDVEVRVKRRGVTVLAPGTWMDR